MGPKLHDPEFSIAPPSSPSCLWQATTRHLGLTLPVQELLGQHHPQTPIRGSTGKDYCQLCCGLVVEDATEVETPREYLSGRQLRVVCRACGFLAPRPAAEGMRHHCRQDKHLKLQALHSKVAVSATV